ncbi:MAG: sulfite exporter TauE/SafE family protein [Terrisporobacter sp.]
MLVGIIGFFAGIIGGMGMGGGTILIPALVLFAVIDPKLAQSINLLSSIPMTITALIIHIKNNDVELNLVAPIAIFGIAGAMAGSLLAEYLNSEVLRKAFGIFLFLIGLFEIQKGLRGEKKKSHLSNLIKKD